MRACDLPHIEALVKGLLWLSLALVLVGVRQIDLQAVGPTAMARMVAMPVMTKIIHNQQWEVPKFGASTTGMSKRR